MRQQGTLKYDMVQILKNRKMTAGFRCFSNFRGQKKMHEQKLTSHFTEREIKRKLKLTLIRFKNI